MIVMNNSDLAKFRHFAKILIDFFRGSFSIWQILEPSLPIFYILSWAILLFQMASNFATRSHCFLVELVNLSGGAILASFFLILSSNLEEVNNKRRS